MAKSSGEFSFADLNKEMSKNSKWGGLMSDDNVGVSEITDYIPVGNYICNACLTGSLFQGIPNNRITALSGVSGVGKTYLLLNIAREAILKGYYVIWYDSENAIEKKMLDQFGINRDYFRYEPALSVELFRTSITQTIDLLIEKKESGMSIPKVFFVLDSLGGLPTEKEIEDAKSGSDKADMTKAKKLRSIFRIISMKMGIIGATMALSNHVYENTNAYVPTSVQSGGQGLVYGASVILNLSKAKLKEDGDNKQTGIIVTAKPDKNRFVIPHTVQFYISYVNGMNKYVGLQDYISWERCGIDRGKFITESEALKSGQDYPKVVTKDGEIKYFVQSDTGRNVCCDDGTSLPWKSLWSAKVFNKERLERLDKYIQSEFKYADGTNPENIFEADDEPNDVDDMIGNQLD